LAEIQNGQKLQYRSGSYLANQPSSMRMSINSKTICQSSTFTEECGLDLASASGLKINAELQNHVHSHKRYFTAQQPTARTRTLSHSSPKVVPWACYRHRSSESC